MMMKDEMMKSCTLCQRGCRADRTIRAGRCGGTDQILAARAAIHMWEEPCISGKEGSGTVFFAGCPLGCVFCQNHEIAPGIGAFKDYGRKKSEEGEKNDDLRVLTEEELAAVFLSLQEQRANNINLVTPTHYVPQIIEAVRKAREQGLHIPVLYNTGSYETTDTVDKLDGIVDIYLPDLKFYDPEVARRYAQAPDYFETASRAIDVMIRQIEKRHAGDPRPAYDDRGMMQYGVIVRHMILPGHTKDSKRILEYLYRTYGDSLTVSIMNQYTPMPGIERDYPELGRKVTKREYERVIDYALELGFVNAYIQEGATASESFIPSFHGEGLDACEIIKEKNR
ncbi:MAG: radical SAM protein [Lachnospiraceae bacterium]|nr:radical SAM protein [Lachnospiraceae bacterium]